MPVDFDKKLLFIHIPKNAGTSVTKAFAMQHEGHYPVSFYKNQMAEDLWQEYTKFCIVRNPWDRVVSCYEYARMEKSYYHAVDGPSQYGKHPDYDLLKDASFEECIELLKEGKLTHQGWTLQSLWIHDKDVLCVDDKLENLPDKLYEVEIEALNKSTRKDYQSYYNEETKQAVEDLYKVDIELFDYEF